MGASFDFDNPVFKSFCFYVTVCVFKMLALGLLTSLRRVTRGVFSSEEDCRFFNRGGDASKKKPVVNDEAVERARRNQQNDMEVIVPFALVGFFFCLDVGVPSALVAQNHFRVFTAARFLHTLCYQLKLQPFRSLAHIISVLVIVHMGVHVIVATKAAL